MYILGYAILTLVYIVNINNKNHRAGHLFMTPEFFHGCVIVLRPHLETVPYVPTQDEGPGWGSGVQGTSPEVLKTVMAITVL